VGVGVEEIVTEGVGVGVGIGETDGVTEIEGVGVGVMVMSGVGEVVGVGVEDDVGVGVAVLIRTPLFQTCFPFDFTQLKSFPLKTTVAFAFVHFAPATGFFAACEAGEMLRIEIKSTPASDELPTFLIRARG